MIDTHAHLNFPELESQLSAVLDRAKQVRVQYCVIPGTNPANSAKAVALAKQNRQLFAAVGVHPNEDESADQPDQIESLIQAGRVVAIGEVGLDHYRLPATNPEATKQIQEMRFAGYLEMARRHDLPVIIHSRNCFDDAYRMMKTVGSGLRFVIHCFSGTQAEAEKWLDLGGFLSFTAIITYPKNTDLREIAAWVPIDRFMLETDAPFLAPQSRLGQLCEPSFLIETAQTLAEARKCDLSELDQLTTANAIRFFKLEVD